MAKFFTQKTFASRIRAIKGQRARAYRQPPSDKLPTLAEMLTSYQRQRLARQETTKGENDHA